MSNQPARSASARDTKPGNVARDQAAPANPPIALPFNPDDDRFTVPDSVKRKGWRLEWKRYMVLGQPDHANLSKLQREGWQVVPATRWQERNTTLMGDLLPQKAYIELEGLVLMERREVQCQAVEAYFHNQTAEVTAAKQAELGESTDPKNFPRTPPRVSTTVEGPVQGPPAESSADEGEDFN